MHLVEDMFKYSLFSEDTPEAITGLEKYLRTVIQYKLLRVQDQNGVPPLYTMLAEPGIANAKK